jgi:hypothetical protein
MARVSVATADGTTLTGFTQTNVNNAGSISIDSGIQFTGQFNLQAGVDLASVRWTGAGSFNNDGYSSIKCINFTSNGGAAVCHGVTIRCSGADATRTCYEAFLEQDSTTTPVLVFQKWVNGTRTLLNSGTVSWSGNASRLELEAVGTTITVMKDGVAIGGAFTQTDSSISSGVPGFSCTSSALDDDWDAGNFSAATVVLMGQVCT